MPFVAEPSGETVTPAVADRDMVLTCSGCDGPLTVVQRHERNGSFVASHFRHGADRDGGCGCESPIHEKVKSIAADRLRFDLKEIVEIAELHIDSRHVGGHLPDVLVLFEEPTHPHGRGIAVECQYRHEGKDREATEQAGVSQRGDLDALVRGGRVRP